MMLKLAQVVKEMRKTDGLHRPRPFSLIYCTADRTRNKGGQIRELNRAILLTRRWTENRIVDIQPLGTKDCIRIHLDLILFFNNQPVA